MTTKKVKQVTINAEDCHGIFIARDAEHAKRLALSDDLTDVLWSFLSQNLRDKMKYGHEFKTADEALDWVKDNLYSEMCDHGINLDDIWR